ncbi:unnamed protein product [Gulo gulo]|uniref:Uncharacterized protein n=1 Tax=Gulo gulo TaxID=48420 RepID=A0A9X9MC45_GULGU|nr:unnamed protein product [Gulo gulo]
MFYIHVARKLALSTLPRSPEKVHLKVSRTHQSKCVCFYTYIQGYYNKKYRTLQH